MTTTQLKQRMLGLGLTGRQLATAINASPSQVSDVLHGHRKTPWIRRGIAGQLQLSFELAWGVPDPGVDRLPAGRPGQQQAEAGV